MSRSLKDLLKKIKLKQNGSSTDLHNDGLEHVPWHVMIPTGLQKTAFRRLLTGHGFHQEKEKGW